MTNGSPSVQQQTQNPNPAVAATAAGGTTPTGAGGAAPGAPTKEEQEKAAREGIHKFNDIVAGLPGLQAFLNGIGLNFAPPDPTQQVLNSVFGDIVNRSLIGGGELKSFQGNQTVIDNMTKLVTEMFEAKPPRLVFDADPVKNREQFNMLVSDIADAVKKGEGAGQNYNVAGIVAQITAKARELGTDVTVRADVKLPELQKRHPANEHLSYGAPIQVAASALDKLGLPSAIRSNLVSPDGTAYDVNGTIKPGNLGRALGDNITIERVQQDGYNHGYFVSNGEGKGYYVDSGVIDLDKLKKESPDLYNQLASAAPAAAGPAPVAPAMSAAPVTQQPGAPGV